MELLGDVGGLFDGLRYLVLGLVTPLAAFSMKAELLYKAFRVVDSKEPLKKE